MTLLSPKVDPNMIVGNDADDRATCNDIFDCKAIILYLPVAGYYRDLANFRSPRQQYRRRWSWQLRGRVNYRDVVEKHILRSDEKPRMCHYPRRGYIYFCSVRHHSYDSGVSRYKAVCCCQHRCGRDHRAGATSDEAAIVIIEEEQLYH
jgi:hypothetical protein